MKCYFDKSVGEDDAGDTWLTLGGLMAPDAEWWRFNNEWHTMLRERYPIAPFIHMTEMFHGNDPFERGAAGWTEEKACRLVMDAVNVLQNLDKGAFLFLRCSVNTSARRRLIREGFDVTNEVTLCNEICIGYAFHKHYIQDANISERAQIIFDQGEPFIKLFRARWQKEKTAAGQPSVDPVRIFGSAQEFDGSRILGCFPNDEFGLGVGHALRFEQQVAEVLIPAAAA